jgi:hypothetical protein
MPRFALLLSAGFLASPAPAGGPPIDFHRDVKPILEKSCFACHGPEKQKAGLRLDSRAELLKGGDGGPAVVPGKGADSLLVKLAGYEDADRPMPPKKEKRLSAEQVGTLRRWIDEGAAWPGSEAAAADDPRDWWSLKPLARPAVPDVAAADATRVRNPIDRFVLAKLREKGLAPSPEADKRTLCRRLYFDLTGLPPTPDDVQAFVADPDPLAYEKLVDKLLASTAYGERWARHWLDVVHYGDTHGYDKDQPRPNAWPYRDYVIRSLNGDKPYSRFVQEQIAGDVLFPGTADGVTALGFIAAGPWDLIGHIEVPESKTDGKIARHLDRDDMVANTMNTFVSLTVQCAQCHNHKFDKIISQADYYRLQAVFAAIDRTDRPYHTDPAAAARYAELAAKRAGLAGKQRDLAAKLTKLGGPKLANLDRRAAAARATATARPEYGYHSQIAPTADVTKWVQIDLGKPVPTDRVVLWGASDDFNNIGAGFGFPPRFKIEVSDDPAFGENVVTVADRTDRDYPNPGTAAQTFPTAGAKARYVRVTATTLAPRKNDFILALAEAEVLDSTGANLARGAKVMALDTIEAPPRWAAKNLTDTFAPGQTGPSEVARLAAERVAFVKSLGDPTLTTTIAEVDAAIAELDREMAKVPPVGRVYAGGVHNGGGNFRGTGPDNGKPRPIHLLKRGDVRTPAAEVQPAALTVSADVTADLHLPESHTEGDRRAALARWVTDPRNPLTWRSIVNRVWQYHFGRGLAAMPNDFGKMGSPPSHPELLDWLAVEFRDNGQSLKALHRLMVTSRTYRQSSAADPKSDAIDSGNVYLWRATRRKLEAEEIRDAALAVAGKLDRTMYGPAFQDFVVEHPAHSPHYEYHLHDPNDPKSHRRSIYRFLVRSKPSPFMTVLDCADPSMQVDKRNETLSPLQALALFNNGFMLAMAKALAAKVTPAGGPDLQVAAAFRAAVGRPPTDQEKRTLAKYAADHGLANACRVILNLNEFVFVD